MAKQAVLEIIADASRLKSGLGDAEGSAGKFSDTMGGLGKVVAGALTSAAVIDFGKNAVEAFDASAQSTSALNLALKNNSLTVGVNAGAFDQLNVALSQHALASPAVISAAEAQMATFGESKAQIQKMIPTVLDLAAKLGTDVPAAADTMDKAALGSTKALKVLGIEGYKPTGDKARDLANVQTLLAAKTKGAAQAQLDAAGPGVKLKKSFDELEVTVGSFLVPVLLKVSEAISGVINWVQNLLGTFKTGGFSAVVDKVSGEWKELWPKIQSALSTALDAIGSWIVDTAGPYIKAQFPGWIEAFWKWIQEVTPPALKALGDLLGKIGAWLLDPGLPMLGRALLALGDALWHWIQDNTGPALGKLVDYMAQLGSWILTQGIPKLIGFMANMGVKLIGWISDVLPQLPGKLGDLLGTIGAWLVTTGIPKLVEFTAKLEIKILEWLVTAAKDAPGKIADVITAIAGWMKDKGPGLLADAGKLMLGALEAPFKFVFNTIAGFWNNSLGKISFSVPSWVPGLGGKGFSFPTIPPLAAGGPISGLALVGEKGPELFVGQGTIIPNNALAGGGGGGGGGGNTYIFYVSALDPATAAETVVRAIDQYEARNGPRYARAG